MARSYGHNSYVSYHYVSYGFRRGSRPHVRDHDNAYAYHAHHAQSDSSGAAHAAHDSSNNNSGSGSGSIGSSEPRRDRDRDRSRFHRRSYERMSDRARQTQRRRQRERARQEVTPARGWEPPQPQRRQAVRAGRATNAMPVTSGRGYDGDDLRQSSQQEQVEQQPRRDEQQRDRVVSLNIPRTDAQQPHTRGRAVRVSSGPTSETANRMSRSESLPAQLSHSTAIHTPPPSPTRHPFLHPVRPATRREPIRMYNEPIAPRSQHGTPSAEAAALAGANTPPASASPPPEKPKEQIKEKPKEKRSTNTYKGKDAIKRLFSNPRIQRVFAGKKLPRERKRPDRMDLRMSESRMLR